MEKSHKSHKKHRKSHLRHRLRHTYREEPTWPTPYEAEEYNDAPRDIIFRLFDKDFDGILAYGDL